MEVRQESRLVPLVVYVGGLVMMFLGTRVFPSIPAAQTTLTAAGFGLSFAYLLLCVKGAFSGAPERASIHRLLSVFALFSLLALLLAFFTTETGERYLPPIAKATTEAREKYESIATVIWVSVLLITAVPILFAERALFPMRRAENVEGRRVLFAETAGLTLAMAATYGALFTYAAGELAIKADFSYFRTSRPSESTQNIVRGLEDPVKVNIFFPRINDVGHEVGSYLKELSRAGNKFTFEQHDRLLEPNLAKDWKVTQDGVLVVARGPTEETLSFGTDMEGARAKLKSLDGDFQKALIKVSRETRTVYFTTGHGELNESTDTSEGRTASGAKKLLESQNYTIKDLGLIQGLGVEIPKDATIVAVLGPARPFLPGEVASLRKYAEGGGHLLLALDPDPNIDLEPLAEIAGLTFAPVTLANEKVHLRRRFNDSDRSILATNRYSSHASVSTLSRNAARAYAVFGGAAALDSKPGSSGLLTDFTVKAMPDTFADQNRDFQMQPAEKKAALNLAAAVSKKLGAPGDDAKVQKEMRIFALGDADALSDVVLGNEANAILLIDAARWLGGEESFTGAISSAEDVKIEHTKQKDLVLFYSTIFGVPSLVLGMGLLFSRRGRTKASLVEMGAPAAEGKGVSS
ncbi:MAG TPA: Gldg family protein [Polyangiaceae bacterium]|nr:Gldg family protein [Polyangiaceae bacterium]